jgi:hypothetical protein
LELFNLELFNLELFNLELFNLGEAPEGPKELEGQEGVNIC